MRMCRKSALCALLVLVQSLGSLPFLAFSLTAYAQRRVAPAGRRTPGVQNNMTNGLQFRLSEGVEGAGGRDQLPRPETTKLSDADVERILSRMQPIKSDATDEQDFAMRDRSLPPPRTGTTVQKPFPAAEDLAPPDVTTTTNPNAPLQVTRFSPEGDVPLAPQVSLTFSQPMVAVTSQTDAAQNVPVKLTPQPPGKWRWVGTKTLLFEAANDQRFPMATDYTVEVPAGTKSATGATFASAKRWTFSTPPPVMQSNFPNSGPQKREPLIFVSFDQRVNPEAVLQTTRLTAGNTTYRLKLATADEVAADATVSYLAKSAIDGHWIAFRAVDAQGNRATLPADTNVTVTLGPGTPSAEGPKKTIAPQSFSFRTYGPLRVTRHQCGWQENCSPFDQWTINFTNPLDAENFDAAKIKVEPAIQGMKASVYGNTLVITGIKKGRTTYRVTLDASISDQFDQTLGSPVTLSFKVGSAPPALASSGGNFIVLDPTAQPRFSVYSVNHASLNVRLYKVEPNDWRAFGLYMREDHNRPAPPPGRLVFSKTLPVQSQPDEMAETRIDLAPALDDGLGQVVLVVEPTVKSKNSWENRTVKAWLQATQIGLDAFVDHSELVGWATSLKDGKPIDGALLSISTASGTTRADGIARIGLPTTRGTGLLVARKGKDVAILPESTSWWYDNSSWLKRPLTDSLRWFVFDDRKMYKPGEEVHVKGWIRRIGAGQTGDVMALDGEATNVSYVLRDSRGNQIATGTAKVNALGGFDFALKLPGTMNLGQTNLQLNSAGSVTGIGGSSFNHQFQVQEFRRPEFEVSAQASEGPHFVGKSATATVSAAYYAGGGLPNADVNWQVRSTPTNYTPPNRYDFTFGTWVPWWRPYGGGEGTKVEAFQSRTDPAGKHTLKIDFVSADNPRPYSVTAEASVMDVNRQAWNASTNMLVHPSSLYVGMRSPRTFVQKGEPLVIQTIVTDIDGKAIAGRTVKVRAVLLDWVQEKGEWKQKEVNPQECEVKSTADAVECRFDVKDGGMYRVTATVFDDLERTNRSELTLWVAGGKVMPKRDVEQEEVPLVPNQKEYQPGDTAEILVQAPFFPAEGTLTLSRSGIVSTERFRMETASHTLRIPIKESYLPNLHVQVDLVGAAARTDDKGQANEKLPKRPAFGVGSLNLTIPPLSRKLAVTATPKDKQVEPGEDTSVTVEVKDATGRAVANSEVALVVVDEAILGLTGYRVGDPLWTFYSQRTGDISAYHSREHVLLANPEDLLGQMQQGGVAGGVPGGVAETMQMASPSPPPAAMARAKQAADATAAFYPGEEKPINVRENFNPLAVFSPSVKTDSDGRATVAVKMPDNLTRYRVMAVAVAGGKQFGMSEAAVTARLPLMVRPSAPRFLNFGDRFELPVVIQNQTDFPMDVGVAIRTANAELTDGGGRRVTVPANDRVEVRFPTSAAKAGTARFQIAAVSGEWADAAEISLPVWTPATTEAFATYGEVDKGAIVQPVQAPTDAIKQFGGLEVTTSSTQLQALTDAVLYLVAYPFECAEQLSSRVIAVAALKDVLGAFKAKGLPPPDEMVSAVRRDIRRLQTMQNADGGFGFWRRNDESFPYVSIHVAHALQRAKEKKFDVPQSMLDRSRDYLRNIESRIPSYYSIESRRALIAYALYVRNRMGDRDTARAKRLIAEATLEKLSLEAVGWLLPVLSGDAASQTEVTAIRRHLNNRATEEAATAHFVTSYSDGEHLLLHSARRADGIILEALIGDQPQNDLIPKVVRGLLAHRKAGRWENTQENAFVLLALDKYFNTYEKVTPDFVARAWLGEAYAGETQFRGRSTDRYNVNVPMKYLVEQSGTQNLILSKEGAGRLYYRIGMQYAPTSLKLDPADYGFTVERKYEAVEKADDVRRDADGTWHIKAGAKVRVKLTMVAQSRRYHVALVDPLPAGLEPMNPALAVTGSVPQDPNDSRGRYWWWQWTWYEHQNLRDERVEAFASLLYEGVYTYSYVARATTPGNFVVPPTKAEEMYHPETFGRSGSDRVIVE